LKIDRTFALLAGFGGSFLAVGLPYWPIPYAMLSLPDPLWNAGLLIVVLGFGASLIGSVVAATLGRRAIGRDGA
jgi:membrane protein implicated in regulation of membrane protease activity